jgi:hypothetical protein
VDSAVEIPGALAAETGAADLRVMLGEAKVGEVERSLGPYSLGAEGVLFAMPGVARFLCRRDGAEIVVQPEGAAAERQAAAFMIATAIPAALWLRGEMVLHGAAAVPAGREAAVGFLGASGAGTSTLLAKQVDEGAQAVAEDSFRVWWEGEQWRVAGLPGGVWLREPGDALDAERRFRQFGAGQSVASSPMRGLVVLAQGAETARVRGLAVLEGLLRQRHRAAVCKLVDGEAALLKKWAALAASVPLYSACPSQNSWGPDLLPDV